MIVGARNTAQLDDNIAAADIKLTPEELATLDKVSALPPEYPADDRTTERRPRAGQVRIYGPAR